MDEYGNYRLIEIFLKVGLLNLGVDIMKYLILGGTKFLGRHIVNKALDQGHQVTIFTRGREKIDINTKVEHLIGDRANNLDTLKGRVWDRVIDTSGYVPWEVEKSARILADSCTHYTFVSSISVYSDLEKRNINEDSKIETMTKEELEEVRLDESGESIMKYYGALKHLCEEAAKKAMPGQVLNVRPGLIVGQFDPTDRFTYWIDRISKGKEVFCPGRKDALIQFINVEDLARWIVKASEEAIVGEYNATGPDYELTMEELLEKCKEVSKSNATLTWAQENFLFDNDVQYWSEMPLWIPDKLKIPGFLGADITKALKKGLRFKPLEETILDTLNWAKSRPTGYSFKAGITSDKEKELLKLWHSR